MSKTVKWAIIGVLAAVALYYVLGVGKKADVPTNVAASSLPIS